MMIKRPADERGLGSFDWLDSRHSFSFADYYDPRHMGFRALRVINDDRIAAGAGFPDHGHRDMEILTYVLDGAIEHRDSMGNGSIIRPGEVQVMSAGTGIVHSEFNPNPDRQTRLLQIWILSERAGMTPRYDQAAFLAERRDGTLALIAAPKGQGGAVDLHQDVRIHAGRLAAGGQATVALAGSDRHAWVQLGKGSMTVNGYALAEGDGLAITGESSLRLHSTEAAELLVFDLA